MYQTIACAPQWIRVCQCKSRAGRRRSALTLTPLPASITGNSRVSETLQSRRSPPDTTADYLTDWLPDYLTDDWLTDVTDWLADGAFCNQNKTTQYYYYQTFAVPPSLLDEWTRGVADRLRKAVKTSRLTWQVPLTNLCCIANRPTHHQLATNWWLVGRRGLAAWRFCVFAFLFCLQSLPSSERRNYICLCLTWNFPVSWKLRSNSDDTHRGLQLAGSLYFIGIHT